MKTRSAQDIQRHTVARTAIATFLLVTFVHTGSTLAQINVQTNEHIYTVQNGDTLQSIATLMTQDSDWRLIKSYNQLQSNSPKPGSTMRIPVGWLKDVRGTATVKAASGVVESDGKAIKAGALLTEKSILSTGKDGSAVVEFNDGSTVAVTPQSRVELAEMRQSPDKTIVSNGLRLIAGQVTSLVKKLKGRSDYRVYTATATAGVRGTAFRVSVDGAAGSEASRSEVIEGGVAFAGAGTGTGPGAEVALAAGYGSVAEAGKAPLPPIVLLPAPQFAGNMARIETAAPSIAWQPVAGAKAYRIQTSRDANFDSILADQRATDATATLPPVADGNYFARVRAIDGVGLEGIDQVGSFKVKATPPAPMPLALEPKISLTPSAQLSWPTVAGARAYRLQIAQAADFAKPLEDREINSNEFAFAPPAFGRYYWRVASLETGDRGPFTPAGIIDLADPPKTLPKVIQQHHNAKFEWQLKPGERATLVVKPVGQTGGEQRFPNAQSGDISVALTPGKFDAGIEITDSAGKTFPIFENTRFTVPPPADAK